MIFDRNIAIAELDGDLAIAASNIRQMTQGLDITGLRRFREKLGEVTTFLDRSIRTVQRGDNWQYYCPSCPYALPPNTSGQLMCPKCERTMRLKTL